MINRLQPLMALLCTTAMFFLFVTTTFGQSCTCNNSLDFDLDQGSNVPIIMDCSVDIDITPSDDPAIAGEWFPDNLMLMASSDPSSCVVGNSISSIVILQVVNVNTFMPIPFPNNMISGLTAGDLINIQFEVTLASGECSTQQYSLGVIDNMPPEIDCPADVFIDCVSDIPNVPTVTFTDNCNVGEMNATYEGQTATPNQCNGGSITRTWTAMDISGFVDTCRQNIIISADVTPPTAAALPNVGPICSQNDAPSFGSVFEIQTASGTDIMDCTPDNSLGYAFLGDVLISGTPTSCPRTFRRSYTLTDDCGNVQTYGFDILVDDPTGPTISNQPQPVTDNCTDNTAPNSGFANWVANGGNATVQEDCGAGVTVQAFLNGTNITANPDAALNTPCPNGGYEVTFVYTNDCGNSTTSNPTTYTINDTTTPSITDGADAVSVDCADGSFDLELANWVSTGAMSTAVDACSGISLTAEINGNPVGFNEILAALNASINDGVCQDNFPLEDGNPFTVDNAIGFVEVTFTYTDACGNPTQPVTKRFTVTDNDPPVITQLGGDLSVSCTAFGPMTTPEQSLTNWLNGAAGGLSDDGCGPATFNGTVITGGVATGTQVLTNGMISYGGASILEILSDDCGITGAVTVRFQATDDCGNLSMNTYDATFTLSDDVDPNIDTQPENLVVNCNDDEAAALAAWTATRGNDPSTMSPGATASDGCGNTTSYFFLAGTYDPNLDPDNNPSNNPGFNSITLADLSDGCGPTGSLSMDVFFVDECGNTAQSFPATFTVLDNTPPNVTQVAQDDTVVCDGSTNTNTVFQAWLNSGGGAIANDNCSTTSFTFSPSNPILNAACSGTGFYSVEFFAQDECGISTSAGTATFTIVDNDPPTVTSFPEAYTVECSTNNANQLNLWAVTRGNNPDTMQPGLEANDNCSGNNVNTFFFRQGLYDPASDVDNNPSNNTGFNTISIADLSGDACTANRSVTVDFFASDFCGNVAGPFAATFSLNDTQGPSIDTQPTNGLVSCTSGSGTDLQNYINNNGGAIASDDCGGMITWSTIPANPMLINGCGNTGAVDIIFVASDECGQTSQTNQVTFEIFDTTDPLLAGSIDITEECGPGGASSDDQQGLQFWIDSNGDNDPNDIDASDDCSEPVVISFFWTDSNGNTGGTGMTPFYPTVDPSTCGWRVDVTYIATDACNNESRNTSFFQITDGTAPEFTSNLFTVQITADSNCDFDDSMVPAPTVSDMCADSGSGSMMGTSSVMVTFNDSASPVVPCSDNVFQRITRTYTATDQCGNSSSATRLIEVRDFMPPTFTIPPNVTVSCEDSLDPAFTGGGITDGADNCSGFDVDFSDSNPGGCAGSGVITRTWTLTDGCGNVNSQQQFITVTDNSAPTITIGADDFEYSCNADPNGNGLNSAFNNWLETIGFGSVANDNCTTIDNSGGTINTTTGQLGTSSWFAFQTGTTTPAFLPGAACPSDIIAFVDFVVRDDCGNSAVTSAIFSVVDDTPPVISGCPTDITITTSSDGLGDCAAVFDFAPPTVIDGCADVQTPCGPISFTSSGPVSGSFIQLTGPNDPNVIVDAIQIDFSVPANPTVAVSDATLNLDFVNLDGEFINIGHTEFFQIFGEGMTLLGQTAPTSTQCGDLPNQQFTIPVQTFNQWASDGIVTINLIPNNPGPGLENQAINNTCAGGAVQPTLTYDCSTPPAGGSLVYNVNGGAFQNATFPTISQAFFGPSSGFTGNTGSGSGTMTGTGTMMGSGTGTMMGSGTGSTVGTGMAFNGVSTVTFIATDCSGNSTSCTFNVTVVDDEAPMFADCPLDDLPGTIATPDCDAVDVELPRPDNDVFDNCELNAYDNTIMYNELRFTAHPNIDGFVMDTVVSSFSLAGSPPPSGDGILNIMFKGDLDDVAVNGTPSQETLNIFGEGGVLLGTTTANMGCGDPMMNVAQITVPAATLQAWSADGAIQITVAPVFNGLLGFNNDGDPNNDDFGINPCVDPGTFPSDVFLTNVTDSGNSMLSVNLAFESTSFGYAVSGATNVPTTMFPSDGSNPTVSLNPGMNTITYSVSDFAGNVDNTSCVRTINVTNPNLMDPVISANMTTFNCPGEDVILTDNSGYSSPTAMWNWYIDNAPAGTNGPEDVLIGTTSIPSITFPALSGSTNYHAIITDNQCTTNESNVVNIMTTVNAVSPIIVASPNPVCEGDDFLLTVTNPQGTFTSYRWEGPAGFAFMGQFPPVISNVSQFNEGLYSVFVVDSNSGCEIPGSVFVDVGELPEVPFITSNSPVCDGESIILETSAVCDSYMWIGPDGSSAGTLSNPLLVTTTPTTSIPDGNSAYDAGLWSVICTNAAGCSTQSTQIQVDISDPIPVAPFIVGGAACDGDDIQLDVNDIPTAITYFWSGPNGFTSNIRNPIVTDAGLYTLTVTDNNGCTGVGSIDVQPGVTPTITAVSYTPGPGGCVTGAENLQFMVSVFPPESITNTYTYTWTGGPNGTYSSITRDAIIPNVTSDDNGNYFLVVTGPNGCDSEVFEILVEVVDAPVTPVITVDEDMICEGETIRIESTPYNQAGVMYVWDVPGIGDTITNVPTLIIDPATVADAGSYSLTVDVSGCVSNPSGTIIVDVTPKPVTPVIVGPTLICEGEDVILTIVNPDPNADYQWTGPANFNGTTLPVTIFDVASANQGEYRVVCTLNGCESDISEPFILDVQDTPITPSITHDGPICLDSPGEELTLSVVAGTQQSGVTYEWFDNLNGGNLVGSTGLTPFLTLTDFSDYTGNGDSFIVNFTAVATLNGCTSEVSIAATVEFNTIPAEVAFAGDDQNVCNQGSIFLNATDPSVGNGMWTQVGGSPANIINPNDANTAVSGLVEDSYIFRWTLSNGGCEDYSFDDVIIVINSENQIADAGGPYEACNVTEFLLNAVPAITGNTGTWTQPTAQEAAGITIVDANDPNTLVTGLEAGNTYTFTWSLGNQGCGPNFDSDVAQLVVALAASNAFAGNDFQDCGNNVMLNANEPDECSGRWTSIAPVGSTVVFDDPNDPNTTLTNVPAGLNTFVWTLDCNECGITSDTVILDFEPLAVVGDDPQLITFGETGEFDVTTNDVLPPNASITVVDGPANGILTDLGNGMFTYQATDFTDDQFTYEVCSAICPDVCALGIVTLRVGADDMCVPPTIFTPNGDNYNDRFEVSCLYELSKYPDNKVTIYNQWGDQVFIAQPYLNDWEGTYNGEDLPVGTYFYVIDLGDGTEPLTGFLVLER